MDALLGGLPVKKLLFMTEPARIEGLVKPHWMVSSPSPSEPQRPPPPPPPGTQT